MANPHFHSHYAQITSFASAIALPPKDTDIQTTTTRIQGTCPGFQLKCVLVCTYLMNAQLICAPECVIRGVCAVVVYRHQAAIMLITCMKCSHALHNSLETPQPHQIYTEPGVCDDIREYYYVCFEGVCVCALLLCVAAHTRTIHNTQLVQILKRWRCGATVTACGLGVAALFRPYIRGND